MLQMTSQDSLGCVKDAVIYLELFEDVRPFVTCAVHATWIQVFVAEEYQVQNPNFH